MTTKTRSWKSEKPGYHQKTVMLRKCGKKCFLGPKTSFPICKKNTCKVSRSGVLAAYIRSRQYRTRGTKYRKISKKTKKLLTKIDAKYGRKRRRQPKFSEGTPETLVEGVI